jgi:hypothetical protein
MSGLSVLGGQQDQMNTTDAAPQRLARVRLNHPEPKKRYPSASTWSYPKLPAVEKKGMNWNHFRWFRRILLQNRTPVPETNHRVPASRVWDQYILVAHYGEQERKLIVGGGVVLAALIRRVEDLAQLVNRPRLGHNTQPCAAAEYIGPKKQRTQFDNI